MRTVGSISVSSTFVSIRKRTQASRRDPLVPLACDCTHIILVHVVSEPFFLEHGGGTRGIIKAARLYLQSIVDLCPYHNRLLYFSFLSERSGQGTPPAERNALYTLLNAPFGRFLGA